MTTEYIYQPALKPTVFDQFAAFCRDQWGVSAPEVVTAMVGAFVVGAGLLGVVAVCL